MSYIVRDGTCDRLTNAYAAWYQEMQILNWTYVPIVITDRNGEQEVIPQCLPNQNESNPGLVVCELRSCVGDRCEPSITTHRDRPIPSKRIEIPFMEIKYKPVYVKELDVVLSTVETSALAIHPNREMNYITAVTDTADASEMASGHPTFAITANDPTFTYSELFVYVFGRVIEVDVKCSTIVESPFHDRKAEDLKGVFITYRKGLDDCYDETIKIPLDNVDTARPCEAVDGTRVLVASSEEKLHEIIKQSHEAKFDELRGMLNNANIISKDVYEKAMEMADKKYENLKKKHEDELKAVKEANALNEQKLKNEVEAEKQRRIAAETREQNWKDITAARAAIAEQEYKSREQVEKARKESLAADQERIKRDALILKVIGGVAVSVLSFGITMITKKSK